MTSLRFFAACLALTLLLFATSCDSVGPGDPNDGELVTTGILVASQGAFGSDDGSVHLFRTDGTIAARYEDLFVQSIALYQDDLYVTSTDRIDVLSVPALNRIGQVTSVPNPRYIAFDQGRAFVTNLYTNFDTFGDGAVTRFDLTEHMAGEPVVIGGNPDGIARIGGRLYVANYDFGGGRTVTVLNADTMQEIERIDVACDGPRMLFADRQQEIQVVCEGNPWAEPATLGAFVTLNGSTGTVTARTDLDVQLGTASLGQLAAYVDEVQELYAIADGAQRVYRFDTVTNSVSATLSVDGAPLNGVDYDPRRNFLYLARLNPTDPFTAGGTLTVHTRDGALVDNFAGAGVVPTHVHVLAQEED